MTVVVSDVVVVCENIMPGTCTPVTVATPSGSLGHASNECHYIRSPLLNMSHPGRVSDTHPVPVIGLKPHWVSDTSHRSIIMSSPSRCRSQPGPMLGLGYSGVRPTLGFGHTPHEYHYTSTRPPAPGVSHTWTCVGLTPGSSVKPKQMFKIP